METETIVRWGVKLCNQNYGSVTLYPTTVIDWITRGDVSPILGLKNRTVSYKEY